MAALGSLPGRSQQIQLLSALLGATGSVALPGLFLYGHTGTGKTVTVRHVMRALNHKFLSVNCIECYTSRILYETILIGLSQVFGVDESSYRCDNTCQFIAELLSIVENSAYSDNTSPIYIMLEKAEKLRDGDNHLIPALLRLRELSGLNIGVILESEIVWEKFRGGTGFLEPIVVHFTDYTKDELLEIICLDGPESYSRSVYRSYADLLLSVFYVVCRNLNELRYQARCHFKKYVEPVERGEVSADNVHKLWRNIEPHLKKSLQMVYMRENSRSMQIKASAEPASIKPALTRPVVELPVYSKHLLIAAYLASFNPAKSDKRFFVKLSGKTKKRASADTKKNNERTSNLVLGPKFFPLDRLMAIFYSIIDEKLVPTANIFCQISTLVSLGLLTQVSGAEILDSPKYKCLVSLDFIKNISRSVNFEVVRYIYDFA